MSGICRICRILECEAFLRSRHLTLLTIKNKNKTKWVVWGLFTYNLTTQSLLRPGNKSELGCNIKTQTSYGPRYSRNKQSRIHGTICGPHNHSQQKLWSIITTEYWCEDLAMQQKLTNLCQKGAGDQSITSYRQGAPPLHGGSDRIKFYIQIMLEHYQCVNYVVLWCAIPWDQRTYCISTLRVNIQKNRSNTSSVSEDTGTAWWSRKLDHTQWNQQSQEANSTVKK